MRRDERGIEGLPLRLMLVAVLISLTLPTVLSSLDMAVSDASERKLASVTENIARTVEEMSAAGPGNVRLVDVPLDLPSYLRLSIGGKDGSVDSTRLTWETGEGTEGTRYLRGATVLTDDGLPLVLTAGDTLRLSCPSDVWGLVRAELA